MNMKIQLVSLLESCVETVEKVNQQLTPNNELIAETVFILDKVIRELDQLLVNYEFENKENEIRFFKFELAPLLAEFIYYKEMLLFRLELPLDEVDFKKHYKSNANRLIKFRRTNIDSYVYFCSNQSCNDHLYFLRNGAFNKIPLAENSYVNIPSQTFNRASFIAIDRLLAELKEIILEKRYSEFELDTFNWTSKEIYLVELIYAFANSKLINNGDVSIISLARLCNKMFGTNIGTKDIYRSFNAIKRRQNPESMVLNILVESFGSATQG